MLTPANPGLFAQAINSPHQVVVRISVLDGQGDKLDEIEFQDGAVSANLASQVTRTADLLVPPRLSPKTESDLLFPNGNRLYIERGIDLGCGAADLLPVFHGRIQAVWDVPGGPLKVKAVDLAGDVRDAGFIVPTNSVPDAPIQAEFQRLVKGALPTATFGPSDGFSPLVGERTWDTDRAQALDDLANSVGAFWYTLPDGRFVIRRVPWTVPQSTVLRIADGLADAQTASVCDTTQRIPGTDLPYLWATSSTRERSREEVANVVTVSAELVNGQIPLVFSAADNDTASVTYIGGNFGIKSKAVRSDVAQTAQQVQTMAEATLKRSKAILDNWSLQVIPDPRIELGDCIEVACQNVTSVQVVAALRMPLHATGRMDLGTRALNAALVVAQL